MYRNVINEHVVYTTGMQQNGPGKGKANTAAILNDNVNLNIAVSFSDRLIPRQTTLYGQDQLIFKNINYKIE